MARSGADQDGKGGAEPTQSYVALTQVSRPNAEYSDATGGVRCLHAPPGTALELTDAEAVDLARKGAIAPATKEAELVLKVAASTATAARNHAEDVRRKAMETAAALGGGR